MRIRMASSRRRRRVCAVAAGAIIIHFHFTVGRVQALSDSKIPTTTTTSSSSTAKRIQWIPSSVTLQNVSHSYPDSLWRKLTSSVPRRRPYALEEISLVFEPGKLNFLLGESSSGKSTLLQSIVGLVSDRAPCSGTIVMCQGVMTRPSRPVYLNTRPLFGQNEIVENIWNKQAAMAMSSFNGNGSSGPDTRSRSVISECLSELLKLPLHAKISELSMSEVYTCQLGAACLQSCVSTTTTSSTSTTLMDGAGSAAVDGTTTQQEQVDEEELSTTNPTSTTTSTCTELALSGPVLLLDEWLDSETSVVVQTVQSVLQDLARTTGAVIVCVTHKPHLFTSINSGTSTSNGDSDGNDWRRTSINTITLCRGKVMSQTSSP